MATKVYKGFLDEAGNEVLLQGAGTKFDKSKNSLAIGNGLTIAGNDQTVLGRFNAPAANAAEVVGGGNIGNDGLYRISMYGDNRVLKASVAREEILRDVENRGITDDVLGYNTKLQYIGVVSDCSLYDITDKNGKTYTAGKEYIGSVRKYKVIEPGWYFDTQATRPFYGKGSYIYSIESIGTNVTLFTADESSLSSGTPYDCIGRCAVVLGVIPPSENSVDNIRTLDWLGNETLKGELLASDCKCLDKFGDVVSLKYLKETVDELVEAESESSGCPCDCSGKADKVTGATNGNLAGLNSEGNLTDSGYKPSDFAAANHTHQISDVAGLAEALANAGGGGSSTSLAMLYFGDIFTIGQNNSIVFKEGSTCPKLEFDAVSDYLGYHIANIGISNVAGTKTYRTICLCSIYTTTTGSTILNTNVEFYFGERVIRLRYFGASASTVGYVDYNDNNGTVTLAEILS